MKLAIIAKRLPVPLVAMFAMVAAGCAGNVKGGGGGKGQAVVAVDETALEVILRGPAPLEFKGHGDIDMSGGGVKASGNIDAHRMDNGFFKAQIYTPIGTTAASITAEDFRGSVRVGKESKEFFYGDRMEGVSFPGAENFTYGQFINTLTGAMPDVFRELPATPDSLKQRKKSPGVATAVWNSDTLSVRAQIRGKKGKPPQLESVIFRYNVNGSKFSMQFAKFNNGAAREITYKQGSKNYIHVKYESIIVR